jgi:hypothetical protein
VVFLFLRDRNDLRYSAQAGDIQFGNLQEQGEESCMAFGRAGTIPSSRDRPLSICDFARLSARLGVYRISSLKRDKESKINTYKYEYVM